MWRAFALDAMPEARCTDMLRVLAKFLWRPQRDSVEQMQEIGTEEWQQCVNDNT